MTQSRRRRVYSEGFLLEPMAHPVAVEGQTAKMPLTSSGARPGAVSMPGAASTPGAQ